MIAAEIEKAADRLPQWWSFCSNGFPALDLDFSWPSLGSLDLVTYFLRRSGFSTEERQEILASASAYLGRFAYEAWQVLAQGTGEEPELLDMPDGVTLRIGSATSSSGRTLLLLNVSSALESLLRSELGTFEVLPDFRRDDLTPQSNLISLFAYGAVTGLSSYATGPLARRSLEEVGESTINYISRMAARSAALHYAKVHPEEKLGQVSELYLNDLIFLPMGMKEDYLCKRAVNGLLAFSTSFGLEETQLLELSLRLALSPDDSLSAVGLVAYTALASLDPQKVDFDPRVHCVARARGAQMLLLRPALAEMRRALGGSEDWLYSNQPLSDREQSLFRLEKELGFIYPFSLPDAYIDDDKVRQIYRLVSQLQVPEALKALGQLIGRRREDYSLRIARALLAGKMGEKEKLEEDFKFLTSIKAQIDSYEYHMFAAEYFSKERKLEDCLFHVRRARRACAGKNQAQEKEAVIAEGNLLVSLGELEEGVRLLDRIDPGGNNVSSAFGQALALRRLGLVKGQGDVLQRFRALWPTNREAFAVGFLTLD